MIEGLECYLVGGAVRDELLNLPVGDRDWVVVGATPDELMAKGFTQVGRDFPVFLHPQSKEEYALARTERKSGHGHTGFVVHADPDVTLEEDLIRRDLTINAIAKDANGELHDPFNGQADIADKVLRHVSQAFVEDPLRVFRVARFAARLPGFSVADETLALMRQISQSGELTSLSAERIWAELSRALACPAPNQSFAVLRACGGLQDWLPELVDKQVELPEAADNFARLPLDEGEYRDLHCRLKAPNEVLQLGLDARHYAPVLSALESVSVAQVCDALDGLKVNHGLDRLERLVAFMFIADSEAQRLRELAIGFTNTELKDPPAPGPEYGHALREAKLKRLAELLGD